MGSMSSIPYQPQDSVEQYTRLMELKRTMQEQGVRQQILQQQAQEGQLNLQDRQAQTAAMQEWNGQNWEDYPGLIKKHGGSAQAVIGATQGIVKMQTDLANRKKVELENEDVKNGYIAQHIENVKALPPEQQPTAFEAAKADLVQRHYMDPQQAQGMQYQGPQQLDLLEKMYRAHGAATKEALETAQTQEATQKAALDRIKVKLALGSKPGDFDTLIDQVATGPNAALGLRTKSLVNFALQRGDIESANKAITEMSQQVGAIEKETSPAVQAGKIAVATAEGQARANIEAATARGSNAALAQVPPHLVGPATAASTKAGEEYAQAQSVTQRLQAMMEAARRGNVVSYQVLPEEGTLRITTSQGVHRIKFPSQEAADGFKRAVGIQ